MEELASKYCSFFLKKSVPPSPLVCPCLSVYILDISVPDFVNFPRYLLY